jgi:hypothetical protein
MPDPAVDLKEIARRGQEYYDRHLRATLEPEHTGKFLVLDVETGDYEMDESEVVASERARAKHPHSLFYILRVGYRAAHCIGARLAPRGTP